MGLIQIITLVFLVVLFFIIIFLLKTRRLKEKYSVLWIIGIIIMLVFTIARRALEIISLFFEVYYPPSFLFALAFLVMLAILLHFSVAISQIEKRQKNSAQSLVILEEKIKLISLNKTNQGQIDKNEEDKDKK